MRLIPARLRAWLERPRAALVAALVGVLLTVPSLFGGVQTEDRVFQSLSRLHAWEAFSHVNLWSYDAGMSDVDRAAQVATFKSGGILPWLAFERFNVALWRPLASFTHQVDFWIFPRQPGIWHAQNLLYFGLTLLAVGGLYRRLASAPFVAGLATWLYAIDDAHGHAVGWVSNRNAILATLFGVLAVSAQDRARRDGSIVGALFAPLALGLSLLSSEFGLGAIAYLIAHALFVDRAAPVRRVLATLPWLAVTALWAGHYRAVGFGSVGSGVYVDPLASPVAFLRPFGARVLALVAAQLGGAPSDWWNRWHGLELWALVVGSLAVTVLVLGALLTVVRRDREARFWAAGAALSLVPLGAVFPEDRLLWFTGLGGMALVARLCAAVVDGEPEVGEGRLRRGVAAGLLIAHGVCAPVLLPWRSFTMWRYERDLAVARASLFTDDLVFEDQLIMVNAPDYYFGVMLTITQLAAFEPAPTRTLVLAGTLDDVIITRLDAHNVEVRPRGGFFSETFDRLYRGENQPMPTGFTTHLPGLTVFVTEATPAGVPLVARFQFSNSADFKRYHWRRWDHGRYVPFALPPVGGRVVVHR